MGPSTEISTARLVELGRGHWRKPRILRRGRDRGARHDVGERPVRLQVADAATQLIAAPKRDEGG